MSFDPTWSRRKMKEQEEYVQGLPGEERQVFQDEMQRELELARVQGLKVRLCTMPNALCPVPHLYEMQ